MSSRSAAAYKKKAKKAVSYRKSAKYARPQRYISGRGAYYMGYGKGTLNVSGNLGPIKGSFSGEGGGGYANKAEVIKGLGEYHVSNIRRNVFMGIDPPRIHNSRDAHPGGTVIRHREYLGQLTSSATANTFKIQTYSLNPAQSQTFPWLASIAGNYEEYMPNGIMFEFKSTCSDAIASGTNLSLGSVIIASQYDPLDAIFQSDIEMLNYEFAQSSKVSDSLCHFVECDPKQSPLNHLYTRAGAPTNNSDLRFSDLCNVSIASYGLQGTNVVLGQIWVSYEIVLFKPKVGIGLSPATSNVWKVYNNSLTQASPFGTAGQWVYNASNDLQCSVTSTVLTLPLTAQPASYLVLLNASGFASMAAAFNTYTFSNCVRVRAWGPNNTALADAAPQSGLAGCTSTSYAMIVTTLNAPTAAPTITSSTTAATNGGNMDIVITQLAFFDPNIYGSG